ncbi:MAG: hypothetical protein ACRDSF_00615 [Pseudonocardiaceae bacterium]
MALTAEFLAGTKARASRVNESSIPVVSSTSDITTPFTGQIIFSTADNLLYRYDGSAWVGFCATGGTSSATRHEARYDQTSVQSIANVTEVRLQFHTATYTTNDVTASGTNNNSFLLNRAGVWSITSHLRLVVGTSGDRALWVNTGTSLAAANRLVTSSVITTFAVLHVSTMSRLAAGTSVEIGYYQDSGAARNTDVSFGANHVSLTWLRP